MKKVILFISLVMMPALIFAQENNETSANERNKTSTLEQWPHNDVHNLRIRHKEYLKTVRAEREKTFYKAIIMDSHLGIGIGLGQPATKYTPLTYGHSFGWSFNKSLSTMLRLDANVDLFNKNGAKTYYINFVPGLQFGVNFSPWIGMYASVGSTMPSSAVYQYGYGEVGIVLPGVAVNGTKIGVRYQRSYRKAFDNYVMLSLSFSIGGALPVSEMKNAMSK